MIGQTISHYKITAKLGAGGMGEVYLATDTNLDRPVAIKFLSADRSSDPEARQRFIHEAKVQAMLSHPNIATFHDVGEERGRAFLVMEYVDGQPLPSLARDEKLSLPEILDLVIQVGEGLQAAHEHCVVHRDIKPENILVTSKRQVKITDFGLARWKGATTLTKDGTRMGTAYYMSPEQAEGKRVDQRSDLFSLGVMLYELVCHQRPFEGEHESAILYEILNTQPQPLARFCRDVPDELQRIVTKCLAKRSEERYQSCADLVTDLRSVGRKTTGDSRAATLSKRKMLVVLPFINLSSPDEEYFADGVTEEITSRLAAVRGLGVISRTSAVQYKNTPKSIRELAADLGVDYVLEGSVRWSRGDGKSRIRITPQLIQVSDDTHLWAGCFDRVMDDVFSIQSEIAEEVTRQLDITLLHPERRILEGQPTNNIAAYHAFLRGRYCTAQPHFSIESWKMAVKHYERAVSLDPQFALAYAELAKAHARLYYFRYDDSEERRELSRHAAESAIRLAPESPAVHLSLGYYHLWTRRDVQQALEEFAVTARDLPEDAEILEAQADALRQAGRWQEALDHYQRSRVLSPRDGSLILEVGITNWWLRRYSEALRACDEAIALIPDQAWPYLAKAFNFWSWNGSLADARTALESVPLDHEWSLWAWYWQEMFEGRYREALERLAAAPDEWIRIKIGANPKSLFAAYAHDLLDEPGLARHAYESAKALLEIEVKQHPDDPRYHSSLGIACAGLQLHDDAVRHGNRAVELYPLSTDAVYALPYRYDLAQIHLILGEVDPAIDLLEHLLSIPTWHSKSFLGVDPRWRTLGNNPRFKKLLEQPDKVF